MVACRKQASSQILSSATKNKFELARFLPFSVQFFMPTNPTISYRETQKETESKIRNQRSSKEQQTTRPSHHHVICIRLPEQISVSPQPLLGSSRRVTWIYSLESRRVSYLLAQLPSSNPKVASRIHFGAGGIKILLGILILSVFHPACPSGCACYGRTPSYAYGVVVLVR